MDDIGFLACREGGGGGCRSLSGCWRRFIRNQRGAGDRVVDACQEAEAGLSGFSGREEAEAVGACQGRDLVG